MIISTRTNYRKLCDAVNSVARPSVSPKHDFTLYYGLLSEHPVGLQMVSRRFHSGGSDSLAFLSSDGKSVVKVTRRKLPKDAGNRPFDLPFSDFHELGIVGKATKFFVYRQPFVQMPVSIEALDRFCDFVRSCGYRETDLKGRLDQVGYDYDGSVKLVDYFAVRSRFLK
jgi:hypothetical protein